MEADLLKAETWPQAVDGCHYVCHVASPFVFGVSEDDEDMLIQPAVQGTTNVLKAAKANEVRAARATTYSQRARRVRGLSIVRKLVRLEAQSIVNTLVAARRHRLR